MEMSRRFVAGTYRQVVEFLQRYVAIRTSYDTGELQYIYNPADLQKILDAIHKAETEGISSVVRGTGGSIAVGIMNCLGLSDRQSKKLGLKSAVDNAEMLLAQFPELEAEDIDTYLRTSFAGVNPDRVKARASAWRRHMWDHNLITAVINESGLL